MDPIALIFTFIALILTPIVYYGLKAIFSDIAAIGIFAAIGATVALILH